MKIQFYILDHKIGIMTNPYLLIDQRFDRIERALKELKDLQLKLGEPAETGPNTRLTRKQLSRQFNISLGTIHNLMKSGRLPYEKVGRKTLFKAEEVEAFFNSNSKSISHD